MFKTRALIEFMKGMEEELKEKGNVNFREGRVARLRERCVELGATRAELEIAENKAANKHVILPAKVRAEIWRKRRLSSNAMQF